RPARRPAARRHHRLGHRRAADRGAHAHGRSRLAAPGHPRGRPVRPAGRPGRRRRAARLQRTPGGDVRPHRPEEHTMRIAIVQLSYGEGADESVADRAARVADLVREHGPGHDLVVLPELWSAGGFAVSEWEERSQSLEGPDLPEALVPLREAVRGTGAVLHTGSVVERTAEPGAE